MTTRTAMFLTGLVALAAFPAGAATWETNPDTWVATDDLGRTVSTYAETGAPRDGKYVGIFYFLWLGRHGQDGPFINSDILAQHPNALQTATEPPWGSLYDYHHWGQALFGQYLSDDRYVFRKHAQMLADAGVDTLIFDVTNQFTYQESYEPLLETFAEVRADGGDTPQVLFLCPFGDSSGVVETLYTNLYGPGLHQELWFRWKGKPLIMANKSGLSQTLLNFFTFRAPIPGYGTAPSAANQWSWLQVYPQHVFYSSDDAKEQIAVGVGQNAWGTHMPAAFSEANTFGRSWHDGAKDPRAQAYRYGFNFQEQFDRALSEDPSFVFVTGWNEWVAMRLNSFNGVNDPVMFVDAFDTEYNRDIEPMVGGSRDDYYYLLTDYVRRYKGATAPPEVGDATAIEVDGDFSDWSAVTPEFRDDRGDVMHRDNAGWGTQLRYAESSGRNDIEAAKVAHGESTLYFYVRTREALTARTDPAWMRLFLNTDRDAATGWEGYDYVINRPAADAETMTLERSTGGWTWETVANVPYALGTREIELAVPAALLGLPLDEPVALEMKWADNMRDSSIDGWMPWGDVTALDARDGALRFSSTGGDPFIGSPRFYASAALNRVLTVRMRCSGTGTANIFWATENSIYMSGDRHTTFTVSQAGSYQTYVINLWQAANWSGTIQQLRIDPPNGETAIEYVRLCSSAAEGDTASCGGMAWEFDFAPDDRVMEFTLSGDAAPNNRFNYLVDISGGIEGPRFHSADADEDGKVSLSELLAVVQLYHAGAYHCADPYGPGEGGQNCTEHDSDYAPADWRVTLTELLRLIQLYKSTAYTACPDDGTEDGYCPA